MRNIAHIPRIWKTIRIWQTIRVLSSSSSIFMLFILLPLLLTSFIVFNPLYSIFFAGILVLVIIVLLRLDELTVGLIVAAHIWLDVYLDLYLLAVLMALVLVSVYYLGQSATRPWTGPRLFWLWILFLILTIYPAINGASFQLSEAESFYVNLVLSPFLLFWLGNIIAKDISSVKNVFIILSFLAVIIAIHTIIEATTGIFLFESAHAKATLAHYANFPIRGTDASRTGSFFGGPDGNAAFLATSLFLPLGLFIESRQLWTKIIYFLEILLILQALIFTYSTGAWLAMLGGMLLFVFLTGRVRDSVLLLVLITTLAMIVFLFFPSQIAAQLYHTNNQSTLSLHLGAWQTAMRIIEAFPLMGIGMGSQTYLVKEESYRVPAQTAPLHEPDNSYLQWGAMAGIPVMLIFLVILGCIFWFAWRNWFATDIRYRPLLGGGIVALVALSISSLSVDGWTSLAGQGHFGWLIAGIVASPLIERGLLGKQRH